MKTRDYLLLCLIMFSSLASAGKSWNFTNWSAETLFNLAADVTNWNPLTSTRFNNQLPISPDSELMANGIPIAELVGIQFGSMPVDKLRIDFNLLPDRLMLNGASLVFKILDCKAGDTLTIVTKTANSTDARGIIAENARRISPDSISVNVLINVFVVHADGIVSLTTTNGIHLRYITLISPTDSVSPIKTAEASLKLHYDFTRDHVSENLVADVSGHGYDAVLMNNALLEGDSIYGSVNLGTSGYVDLGANTGNLVGSLKDFSICCWINPNSLPMWGRIFDFGNDTETFMFLTSNSHLGTPRFTIIYNNGAEQYMEGLALPLGKWSHIAVAVDYDSLSGFGRGKFFINGVLVGTNNTLTIRPATLGATLHNYIGKSLWAADPGLDARIADFRVYGSSLSMMDVFKLVSQRDTTNYYINTLNNSLQFKAKVDTIKQLELTTNTIWNAVSNQSWLSAQPLTGNGSATVNVVAQSNPTRFSRSATLTIYAFNANNQVINVVQDGDSASNVSSYSVYVPQYGQLTSLIPNNVLMEVTKLTVSGYLNANDLSFIRNSFPQLTDVDLSGSTIQWNTITNSAFANWSNLVRMVLPESIKYIEDYAFNRCSSLQSINMPQMLITIGSYAFYYCASLSGQLEFPESLTSIGYVAFYETNLRICKSKAIIAPYLNSYALGGIKKAYIPASSFNSYTQKWPGIVLIPGDSLLTVSVQLSEPGTLGDAILQQVEYVRMVNKLIVSGPINQVDYDLMQQGMINLCSLDLREAQSLAIPNYQFSNKNGLSELVLPDQLLTIGNNAFENCIALNAIRVPLGVTSIGSSAFINCRSLRKVHMPASLTTIGYSAFYNCTSLDSVEIPDGVTRIEYSTFYDCSNLQTLRLSTNLNFIGSYVFYRCRLSNLILPESLIRMDEGALAENPIRSIKLPSNLNRLSTYVLGNCQLDSIVLPPALQYLDESSLSCSSLKSIRCEQATPPVLSRDPFSSVVKSECTLNVPHYSIRLYKLAPYWNNISTIVSYLETPKSMPVFGPLSLASNVRPVGLPDMKLMQMGSVFVGGTAPFHTDRFVMENNYRSYWTDYGYVNPGYAALVNESPDMTANDVRTTFELESGRWYYLSFPYDARVSDIRFNNNALFSVKKYDGALRAANGTGGNWKTMTMDSVLHAYTGYVFQCNTNAVMTVPAMDSTASQLFATTNKQVALSDYPAVWAANSSWNFVGNPYPAFFNTRFIDYTAPITVWDWNSWTYQAISLIDDRYALKPFESFFVQKPLDVPSIGFLAKGRLLNSTLPETVALRSGSVKRTLVNLSLTGGTYSDKCRLVFNSDADLSYEMNCDASKFMSSQNTVSQLYTLDAEGNKYAINERPLGNGSVRLGFYAGVAGKHVISAADLNWSSSMKVMLTDKQLNTQTDLSISKYDFTSEKGTFNDRFVLNIASVVTGNDAILENQTEVLSVDGALVVRTSVGRLVRIYTLNGVALTRDVTTNEEMRIPLAKGIYLVRVDDKVFKSVVF